MNQNLEAQGFPRPAKIFVFGDLKVETENNPYGYVEWWFHVVPILKSEGKVYVFDPAINSYKPLLLQEWLEIMTDAIDSLSASICSTYSYVPSQDCDITAPEFETTALQSQLFYLEQEWSRLELLNRNPYRELGDFPPWLEQLLFPEKVLPPFL